ncbi:MAG TPA: hypothetical protein VF043_10175 [Ktedonobacteraceae bacterium]
MKRKYKPIPPRPRNPLLNIVMLALVAIALAVGDILTTTQSNPIYFIAAVLVSVVIVFAVRRYISRRI